MPKSGAVVVIMAFHPVPLFPSSPLSISGDLHESELRLERKWFHLSDLPRTSLYRDGPLGF